MGRPRTIWHPSRVAALIRMRQAGMSWRRIGEELNVSHVACSRYWQEVLKRPLERVSPHKTYARRPRYGR